MTNDKLSFAEQIRHPAWQKRRLERLEAAGFRCTKCDADDVTLNVHHKHYVKGRMYWEYSDDELSVLCEACHEEEHAILSELKHLMLQLDSTQVHALVSGYFQTSDWFEWKDFDMGRDRDPLTFAAGFLAFLCSWLSIYQLGDVARFAVSLTGEDSEARHHLRDRSYVFGEE